MKAWKEFHITLFLVALISGMAADGPQAHGNELNPDFWWDYGETDKKHATFAPAMEKEISRKTRVRVVVPEGRQIFVADELLQVRYLLHVPFDVRIDERKLPEELPPFEIVGFHFGRRRAIRDDRDMELQELLLSLRLPPSFPGDTYTLPSCDLYYQYDTIVGNRRLPQEETVDTGAIQLEKVSVYVRVQQERNTGFLWDAMPCRLEIHADNSVAFLSPDIQGNDDTLLQFEPLYPFLLRSRSRTILPRDHYRIIRYEFMISLQDFRDQPFTLRFPQIVWRQQGTSAESATTITPAAPVFYIQQLTGDATRVSPLKQYIPAVPGERYRLLGLPLRILLALSVVGICWFTILLLQHYRLKKGTRMPPTDKEATPLYDKWLWQKVLLGYQVARARRRFQNNPNERNCAILHALLARRIAMGLRRKHAMSVAQACALTAEEFLQLGAARQDTREMAGLEKQLASGHYARPGEKVEGGGG